ncbi:hypothetical protein [Dyella ginsengisoli]|uniref:hypothetical protein n=1 Tax=Dyella ginsengisoli TaxID=363848 RepID=UPI00384FE3D2
MADAASPRPGFASWRLGLWVILLLAAFGAMQYGVHAQRVWSVLQVAPVDAEGRATLHAMLAWDAAYFLAAAMLVVFCAGGILRQGWARPVLRVALGLLAAGLLVSGVLLYRQWLGWHGQPHAVAGAAALVAQESRRVHLSLAFDATAIVMLIWLVWRLGQPAVRAQFRQRR